MKTKGVRHVLDMSAVSVLSEGTSSPCQGSRVDMIIFLYNNVKMEVKEGREHHF